MKKNFTLFVLLILFSTIVQSQSVASFINEVNYLASNPTNRGFEIAGEAGSSLDGWSAVLYNLNGTVNSIEDLGNQVIPSQQNGYGTIWYDVDQTSNGGGIALVSPDGVEQFVSYGLAGLITATEGAANGLTSQFIGIQLLPNHSLQLTGTGLTYLDFIWALPGKTTSGGVNVNQILGLLPPVILAANNNQNETAQTEQLADFQNFSQNKNQFFELTVFPNPVAGRLQIRLANGNTDQPTPVRLLDFNGRILSSAVLTSGASSAEMDMSQLPSGQYIVQVDGVSKVIVKR
jgi:hypothetical protein